MNDNRQGMLGQVLGGLFGGAGGAGGLGGVLAHALGGGGAASQAQQDASPPTHESLLLRLLPLALAWAQRSGGLGAVLQRFEQQGYGAQARSWVSRGTNQPLEPQAVQKVVGPQEIQAMAQRLNVSPQQVEQAFAEVMPQLVDHLTPEGHVPQQADQWLAAGQQALERELQHLHPGAATPS